MKQSYFKWIVGLFVILVAGGAISTLNFGDNVVYFYTPKEAVAQSEKLSEKTIKVGGMVLSGTVDWQPTDIKLGFMLSDMKGSEIKYLTTAHLLICSRRTKVSSSRVAFLLMVNLWLRSASW